jgi:hypothetical protein
MSLGLVLIRGYLFLTGAYIIYENITVYHSYSFFSVLLITYLQGLLLMSAAVFRKNWIRVALIFWSLVCAAISVVTWIAGEYSLEAVARQAMYYIVPLALLAHAKSKKIWQAA